MPTVTGVIARWKAGFEQVEFEQVELGLQLELCPLTNELLLFYLLQIAQINCV